MTTEKTTGAEQYRKQLQSIAEGKKTVAEVAEAIGKTRVTVYRYLDALGLRKVSPKRRVKRKRVAKKNGNGVPQAVEALQAVLDQAPFATGFTIHEGPIVITIQAPVSQSDKDIVGVCLHIAAMLVEKNRAYGDSALAPIRVFSKADSLEQIKVRLDDKLNRLSQGHALRGESLADTRHDIMGYLVLMEIAELRAKVAG